MADPQTANDAWPPGLDALRAAPEHHDLLMEDSQVRVLRTRIAPGETTGWHTRLWPAVYLIESWSAFVRRDANGEVTLNSRTVRGPERPAGLPPQVVAAPADVRRPVRSLGVLRVSGLATFHGYASHTTVSRRHRGLPSPQPGTTKEAVMKTADGFLLAGAFIWFVFSVVLWFQGLREEGLFEGIWVPSILAFGGSVRSALQRS